MTAPRSRWSSPCAADGTGSPGHPEYARPKKRGTGVTKEKASVHLERLGASGWESRSHAKDEVGTIVGELLGLTREQFRQVVLLPQGEFATFLRAGDDERREVLGKLFGTQFFRTITDSLQARAQEANRALQAADADLRARVSAACEAAGLESDEHARPRGAPACLGDSRAWRSWTRSWPARALLAQEVGRPRRRRRGLAREVLAEAQAVVGRLEQRACPRGLLGRGAGAARGP